MEAAMAHFEDRAGFAKDQPAARGFPGVAVMMLIAVLLCVVGFLIFFGKDLATIAGGYEGTAINLVGP
jgi:hypothetical protein